MAFLARADDVEERVVDTDRHPNQDNDDLHAVVEVEELAHRTEQPERRADGRQREQHRHKRRHERAEREQQDEERDRH